MTYNAGQLCRSAAEVLAVRPRATASRVATELGVDRHTLRRALRSSGASYRDLQRQATLAALSRLAASDPPRSAKQIAAEVGFPSGVALSHYLRRNGRAHNAP